MPKMTVNNAHHTGLWFVAVSMSGGLKDFIKTLARVPKLVVVDIGNLT